MSTKVQPWKVEPGDQILGMPGSSVVGCRYGGERAYGGSAERQIYLVELEDGRTIPYSGDSTLFVIRKGGA